MELVKSMSFGTFEAKNKLSTLVDLASKGSRIWITKRGRRVALLSSGVQETANSGDDLVAAFRGIRSRTKPLKGLNLKALVEEGRA